MSLKDKIANAVRSLDGDFTALEIGRAFDVLCEVAEEMDEVNPSVYCCRCFADIGNLRYSNDPDYWAPVEQMDLPTFDGNVICPSCVGAFVQENEDAWKAFVLSGREINVLVLQERLEEEMEEFDE